MAQKRGKHPFLPVAIGFFGIAAPLYVSMLFAPDALSEVCEFVGATVLVCLGVLIGRVRASE